MTCLDERLQTHDQHNSEIRCRKNKEIRPTENTLHELTFNAAQKSERTPSYKKNKIGNNSLKSRDGDFLHVEIHRQLP